MERGLSRARRRFAVVTLTVVTLTGVLATVPLAAMAQSAGDRHVVIVLGAGDDAPTDVAQEAIGFWNEVMTELKLGTRLVGTTLVATARSARILENYTRQVWQQAGRLTPGGPGPKEPRRLGDLGADVVVFLSGQPTMSFAWPLRQSAGFFVAVPAETVTRNILAHELGHALGLTHHDNPMVLMCSPCQEAQMIDQGPFLPLTPDDRSRLRELHASAP